MMVNLDFCLLFFSPVGGKLFDSYGPRVPLLIGSVLHVFGLMMLSISKNYYQIMLSQSICSGIGSSLVFSPALAAVRPQHPSVSLAVLTEDSLRHTSIKSAVRLSDWL